jgi:hypothetical protein
MACRRLACPDVYLTTVSGMRHLATVAAALVIAPLAWVLAAYGEDRSVQAFADAQDGGPHSGALLRPLIVLAAAGVLLGLIATLRFSPLGATLAGLAYVASYLALLVDSDRVLDLVPEKLSIAGKQVDPATPLRSGSSMLLGALLLVAVVSVGRWGRRRKPEAVAAGQADHTSRVQDRPLGAEGLGLSRQDWDTGLPRHDWDAEVSRGGWDGEMSRHDWDAEMSRHAWPAESPESGRPAQPSGPSWSSQSGRSGGSAGSSGSRWPSEPEVPTRYGTRPVRRGSWSERSMNPGWRPYR